MTDEGFSEEPVFWVNKSKSGKALVIDFGHHLGIMQIDTVEKLLRGEVRGCPVYEVKKDGR